MKNNLFDIKNKGKIATDGVDNTSDENKYIYYYYYFGQNLKRNDF